MSSKFVLWTAVMVKYFESEKVRATSCYVEGDFGELKNSVLKDNKKAIRTDKFYLQHYTAVKGQILRASTAITTFLMNNEVEASSTQNDESNLTQNDLCSHNPDLFETENWRNKVEKQDPSLGADLVYS